MGLLPIAVAGHDIRELMEGAGRMAAHLRNHDTLDSNPSAQYAVIRNILLNKGMSTEIMASYNPAMQYMIEWWKQLFGESEGKEGKGDLSGWCYFYHRPAFHGSVYPGRAKAFV